MIRAAAILGLLCLSGCVTVAEVQSAGAPPRMEWGIGGLTVERGQADAVTVSGRTIGLGGGCYSAALGYSDFSCTLIDPRGCPVAIIENVKDKTIWAKIADATKRANCPS